MQILSELMNPRKSQSEHDKLGVPSATQSPHMHVVQGFFREIRAFSQTISALRGRLLISHVANPPELYEIGICLDGEELIYQQNWLRLQDLLNKPLVSGKTKGDKQAAYERLSRKAKLVKHYLVNEIQTAVNNNDKHILVVDSINKDIPSTRGPRMVIAKDTGEFYYNIGAMLYRVSFLEGRVFLPSWDTPEHVKEKENFIDKTFRF